MEDQTQIVTEWEAEFRKARNRCSVELDVWAAVEICRRELGPEWSPTFDDATGKWQMCDETIEEFRAQRNLLNDFAEKRVRHPRPLSKASREREFDKKLEKWEVNDAKVRVAVVDVLLKVWSATRFQNKAGKPTPTRKPLIGKDGTFSNEYETWSRVSSQLWGNELKDIEISVLRVRPRKGRWSGMGSDRRKTQRYYSESRHVRNVNRFLDEWAMRIVGPRPKSHDSEEIS